MSMWFLNGCNPISATHNFKWTGISSAPDPWYDVDCGCGSFVMKANTSKIVPSDQLNTMIVQTAELAAAQEEPHGRTSDSS